MNLQVQHNLQDKLKRIYNKALIDIGDKNVIYLSTRAQSILCSHMSQKYNSYLKVEAVGSFFITSMILLSKPLLPLHMRLLEKSNRNEAP